MHNCADDRQICNLEGKYIIDEDHLESEGFIIDPSLPLHVKISIETDQDIG